MNILEELVCGGGGGGGGVWTPPTPPPPLLDPRLKNVQWSVILVISYVLLLTVNNKKGSQNRPHIKSSNYFQHLSHCRHEIY